MKYLVFALLFTTAAHAAPERTHLGLTVTEPPTTRTESARDIIPLDIEGTLLVSDRRVWVGPSVPEYVPLGIGALELVRLQPTPHTSARVFPPHESQHGHLALYREMFGRPGDEHGCAIEDMWENCKQVVRFYRADGSLGFEIDLHALFPTKRHLVVHDLLLVGSTLYYNEACQTYAAEAKGKCSNVVALNITGPTPTLLWRSEFKRSRDLLLVVGDYLVTGYGFTAEKDLLYLLDRKTGRTVTSAAVKKAPSLIGIIPSEPPAAELYVYDDPTPHRVVLERLDTKKPRLKL